MSGDRMADAYWPTARALAVLNGLCVGCGLPAFACPCAAADNEATGQGDEEDAWLPA